MRSILLLAAIGFSLFPHSGNKEGSGRAAIENVSVERSPSTVIWGSPLDGGAISALFIAPQFALRDVGELALRLDLKYDVASVAGVTGPWSEDAVASLRSHLAEHHDVIVIGNIDLSYLPEDVLDSIAGSVKAGSGLLLAHYRENIPKKFDEFLNGLAPADNAEGITRGIAESMTPEWPMSLGFVKASRCEQGRIVELNYAGGRPASHFLMPALSEPLKARPEFFDTYLSLVCRAARWAAGRAPQNWIASVALADVSGPSDAEIPPDLPREYVQEMRDSMMAPLYHSFRVNLNGPAANEYDVQVQVREPNRGLLRSYPNLPKIAKGATGYSVDLPIGPGKYFLDLWLLRKKKVVEWHSEAITVSGWPEISEVSWSKGNLLPNDALMCSLTVRADYHRPRPCVVYARATDGLGRLVAESRESVAADGGQVHVTLSFADLISNIVKTEVFVVDTPRPQFSHWELDRAAYSHLYLPVRSPRKVGDFGFAAESGACEEYNARALTKAMTQFGADSAVIDAREDALTGRRFYLAEMNLRPIPELTRYAPMTGEGKKPEFPCVAASEFRKDDDKRIKENTSGFWAVGTSVYLLGNASRLAAPGEDVGLSECYLEGFRKRLTEQYGFVATLNKTWGSQFGSWDVVAPSTPEDAAKEGRYAPWLDFRRYMDRAFCDAHVKGSGAVRATDTDARTGFRAMAGSDACLGYDWSLLASQIGALAIEPDPVVVEMVRSYRAPDGYSAMCIGSNQLSRSGPECRWLAWYAAIHGMQSLWCTSPFASLLQAGGAVALSQGGQPSGAFKEMTAAVSELKSGVGTLLASAKRKSCGIAIYGSQSSLYLNQILSKAYGSREAEASFMRLLHHLALPYDFVSSEQVLQGKLEEYALVILPMVRSLSDTEVESIRAFNAKGGRVIADISPGEFDAHGVHRKALPLDDMFGVRHKEAPKPATRSDCEVRIGEGDKAASNTLKSVCPDLSVECDKAHACGEIPGAPVWCTQGSDKSFTALLNHPLPSPASGKDSELFAGAFDGEESFTRAFGALLEEAGVTAAAQVTSAPGRTFNGECVSLRYGEADIVAILADPASSNGYVKASLDLGKDWWASDVRKGKPLGHGKKLKVKVDPGDAFVVSLLPYAVTKLRLEDVGDVLPGRRVPVRVSLETNGPVPGAHLIHVTLQRGLVAPIPYYSQNVLCSKGKAETFIPLALDETPGVYTLIARDVLTGASAKAVVNIANREKPSARGGFAAKSKQAVTESVKR